MGNPTTKNNPSLDPLRKTLDSLKEIKSALFPFLRLLKDDDNCEQSPKRHSNTSKTNEWSNKKRSRPNDDENDDELSTKSKITPYQRAEAEAAVALAIGTLRYMGARLQGLDRGRKKGDPLRMELDKIRGMLVSLSKMENDSVGRKKQSLSKPTADSKDGKNDAAATSKNAVVQKSKKRREEGVNSEGGKQVSKNKKQRR
mmetsp:Transcript_42614/g.72682  ORF Transcript_42614/g.72682 Transcript_42614/m.72682 type:complete len:200 (+) Transcript_42614:119-718(+)|eukprot:CAMPEP_0183739538 /NCGR_PEP_ID=MMETSP0737-20130205/57302_1 /TAXON_ID=385413 /ORGANISM="Thalassiosira miniscula, Strain CCMP1093" /LENGTH=199 /DNA_ID=CAMNT_0025974369 /DNA_START=54 /DNA_END=653 /DNA_ORIENTATION=-